MKVSNLTVAFWSIGQGSGSRERSVIVVGHKVPISIHAAACVTFYYSIFTQRFSKKRGGGRFSKNIALYRVFWTFYPKWVPFNCGGGRCSKTSASIRRSTVHPSIGRYIRSKLHFTNLCLQKKRKQQSVDPLFCR